MRTLALITPLLFALTSTASAAVLQVGPGKPYSKPCDAIAAAKPGDTVEVQAGTYTDTCPIGVAGLTLKGVGGRPKIDLSSTDHPSGYKGIYVVTADDVTVENLELTGANITCGNGANGAGLRVEGKNLTVRGCYIHDNQNGILGGAGTMTIEYTEFAKNGLGPACTCGGCSHNLYVGQAGGKLVFRYNYSHDIATDGHLLKSRADEAVILYNRFSGEAGHDSYAIDLPDGGLGVVVGNMVQKGPSPGNFTLLTWGEEGVKKADKRLFVVNNTFVNDASKGTFINVAGGGVLTARNNLFFGPGTISSTGALSADNLSGVDPLFVNRAGYDYHLKVGSPAIDKGVDPGSADAFALTPIAQYVHPAGSEGRAIVGGKLDLGAFEYGVVPGTDAGAPDTGTPTDTGVPSADGGTDAAIGDSGATPDGSTVGDAGADDGLPADPTGTDAGGCGCEVVRAGPSSAWALLALALPLARRRRRAA